MKRPAAAAKMEKQSSIVETEEEETAALTLDIKAGVGTLLCRSRPSSLLQTRDMSAAGRADSALSDVSTVSSDLADLPTPATPEPSPSIDDVSAGEEAYYPLVFLSSDLGAEEEDLVPSEHAAAHP